MSTSSFGNKIQVQLQLKAKVVHVEFVFQYYTPILVQVQPCKTDIYCIKNLWTCCLLVALDLQIKRERRMAWW